MNIKSVAAAFVLVGAASLALAPVASAGEFPPGTAHVNLDTGSGEIQAGGNVVFEGNCTGDPNEFGTLRSPAVGELEVQSYSQPEGEGVRNVAWFGPVRANLKPGTYPVTYNCGGQQHQSQVSLVAGPAKETTTKAPTKPQVPIKPQGPADTGDGSYTAQAHAGTDGSDIGMFVLGGTALAGLGVAGGLVARRRSAARR